VYAHHASENRNPLKKLIRTACSIMIITIRRIRVTTKCIHTTYERCAHGNN
jgi:hypothetical protein